MDDIVEPRGGVYTLPLPFLWQHGSKQPSIGHVIRAVPTDEGISVRIQVERDDEPGPLKDLLDLAWRSIKKNLVRGLSIGFKPLEAPESIKGSFGMRYKKWEWLELSAVTIPANAQASISVIKSICDQSLTALGGGQAPEQVGTPRVRGAVVRLAQKDVPTTMKKTIAEQIAGFEAKRAANQARLEEIQQQAADRGENKDESERDEFNTLKTEIKGIDEELVDLRDMEQMQKAAAVPVVAGTAQQASASRGGSVIQIKDNTPPGIGIARLAMAKVCAKIDGLTVREVISDRWPNDARLKQFITKAAVPAGTTTDAGWAGNLVDTTNLASEFIEFLRPQTIVGRIPLRRVPFNIRVTGQTTGAVANWVQQAKAKPVTSFSTTAITLGFTKIAAISVITEELARFSSPSAEALVRDELARAVIERMDVDFIDPASAAVANVNPASITNGLTALSSAGTSADNIRTDLQNLLEAFLLQNMNTANVVLIMPNTLALAASMLTNSLGQPEFPDIGINGGKLRGIPVVTSQYAANQSGSGNLVIALDPSQIFLADDGQVNLSASTEASIEMSDAPANASDVPTGASLTSMWQTNSVAIKAERFINWAKARSTAVVYMDDVNWGSIGSPS